MEPIAECVAKFLETHPHPALRLDELLGPVAARIDRSLTLARLRHVLAEHPTTFRLLDPWSGPWRMPTPVPSEARIRTPRAAGPPSDTPAPIGDPTGDVWVVLLSQPEQAAENRGDAVDILRETVRWLARSVDARSPLSVSRWYAIALAERESRRVLARRAAG
jgi:hypothetical protein